MKKDPFSMDLPINYLQTNYYMSFIRKSKLLFYKGREKSSFRANDIYLGQAFPPFLIIYTVNC